MAEALASIYGTEKDKVNCPFYFKIGACRHGERCARNHNKPSVSPTLLLTNMYPNPESHQPIGADGRPIQYDPADLEKHFGDFYEDVFAELAQYGEIREFVVAANLGEHLLGNVYVQFSREEQAAEALKALNGRYYAQRPIIAAFSPVTDFHEARCRQFELGRCNKAGYCNFLHPKYIDRRTKRALMEGQPFASHRRRGGSPRRRSSRSPPPRRRRRSRSRSSDRRYHDDGPRHHHPHHRDRYDPYPRGDRRSPPRGSDAHYRRSPSPRPSQPPGPSSTSSSHLTETRYRRSPSPGAPPPHQPPASSSDTRYRRSPSPPGSADKQYRRSQSPAPASGGAEAR